MGLNRGRQRPKGPWARVRRFIGMINWWVAAKMLVILLLVIGVLTWVLRRFR